MDRAILPLLVSLILSLSLYAQHERNIYGINLTNDGIYLGKMDLNTGILSNSQSKLPPDFNSFGSQHTPALDPLGNRYFLISYDTLWSIDLNTGEVLNSYYVSGNELWCMQYNFLDSTLYGINFSTDGMHLGKIDLNTGIVSNCQSKLPPDLNSFGSQHTPALDPYGNRYFLISYDTLWSIDLNTGEALNSYHVSGNELWCMQYNFLDSTMYGINFTEDGKYLGKIDLNTGIISNCQTMLPDDFNSFGSQYFPTIDPLDNRYFMISSNKLWSIDLNTGEVLNSYSVSGNDLWCMQYNYKESILGVEQVFETDLFSIYPNPTKECLYIESKGLNNKKIKIRILDIWGHVLLDKNLNNDFEKIDISYFSIGVYIIQILGNHERRIEKIVKR